MYKTYVLQSLKDKFIYIGITNNVEKRLKEHNDGNNKSTKSRIPFIIIYQEDCRDRLEARKREKWLKSGEGREFIKNNF